MRKFVTLTAIAIAVALLFGGCATSRDSAEHDMTTAVVAASPEIDGALAGYSSSGSELVLNVKAYIPNAKSMSPQELADVVKAGLEAVWFASPRDPFIVHFAVVPTAVPKDATYSQQDVERFPETGEILDSESGFPDGTFGFTGSALEQRFGARP